MAETKQRYRELTTKRASAKGQITKFKNYLASISIDSKLNTTELTEFKLKLAKFEALSVKVDDLQSEIEVLYPDNLEAEIEERDTIEQDVISSIATAKTLLECLTKHNECEHRHNSHDVSCCSDDSYHHHHGTGLKLPQIQIERFSGEYFRWLEFRDTFENLIHKNERIPEINKFHYLASYLQGDAARIISNLEISSKNYTEAWALLCSRYDNKRILINHHLNSLLNIKQLPRESERSLRFLVDHVTKNLRALASLGQPTTSWDVLIIFMLSSKLDSHTLIKWEEHHNTIITEETPAPTLKQFFEFLKDRANVLESLNRNNKSGDSVIAKQQAATARPALNYTNNSNNQRQNIVKSFASSTSNNRGKNSKRFSCIICNQGHKIYECPTFKAKGVDEKLNDVVKYKLCKNCLRQGHGQSECRMGPCREPGCSERHNSLLHSPPESFNHLAAVDEQDEVVVNFSNQNKGLVLLSTAIIEASNPAGQQKVTVRAMLDCGSTSSFITESLKSKLSLKSQPIDCLKVIGIGNSAAGNVTESCNIKIQSINSDFNAQFSCLVLKELTGQMPKTPIDISSLKLPDHIKLADSMFHKPAPIDVLIGADLFWDILGNEQYSLGNNNPKLRNSKLGWIISGPIQTMPKHNNNINNNIQCHHAVLHNCNDNNDTNIEKMLAKFWDLEDVPIKGTTSQLEHDCERHFISHTTRDEHGRFCVKLPLKESADCLGGTYNLARKRFVNLEKRFKRNPSVKSDYTKFINEYAELGHLTVSSDNYSSRPCYHLCHHAVFKQSESTSCRVVFDASAPSTSGYSLNDILMVGPNVQDSLFSILLRARQYKYLLTGDIEKMYRQILVHEDDRHLQLILWRDNESQPIETLVLNTLTYGTANASYQSTRCLFEVGKEQDNELIRTIIQRDFYVDDLITGANNDLELKYIQISVANALKTGCFNLRKYKTNCPAIFDDIETNENDNLTISESSSTLGLGWKPSNDTLHFPIKGLSHNSSDSVTKRSIMSNAFTIFDPLGILSPVVIRPKIMLQRLWQLQLDWDQPVPQAIANEWFKFANSVKCLADLQVPRLVLGDTPKFIEMHSFSDASQHAYGACIYMKTIGPNDVTVRLLCAKSKVAPLKSTNTIPRLELCAALLSAKLSKSVLQAIRYRPERVVHWCDSSVVLGWIRSDVTKLKVFVANRIREIQDLTASSAWRYCPTGDNPADLVSRGVDADRLESSTLWWSGPQFLIKNESEWPILNSKVSESLPELKVHSAVISRPLIDFEKYSSLTKLQRSFANVLRFIFNLKNKNNKRVGILSPDELNASLNSLCAFAQRESFPVEYELLEKGKELSKKSRLLALSPFFDTDKLIRVGGRIQASGQPYDKRHPILLSATHKLTKLYFQREHLNNMHAGPQLLLATVREAVWAINGRHLARRTVNNCTRCRRLRGQTLQPKMGNLPTQRVSVGFVYSSVGVDMAGPFYILNRKGRGSRLIKCYLCLFVCLRYKCLHLEAVSDLTKDAFIMALKRFISRRGRPVEIFCDNGGCFVAAAKEIGAFIKHNHESISDFASQISVKFCFLPAYSPHFGGIWEAGVKSAKHLLGRVIGNSHLTFEEISTLFTQAEAILNSRPICPLSSSPNDLLSLTPGHFIIGRPLTALPTRDFTDAKENQLRRYERLEKMRRHFWQRWQKEYLSEMQQRTKWRTNSAKLNVGDMVLLAEDNAPPLAWRLGRVIRLITGPDGISRVADIHTNRGCVRRSLVRLCKLPTAEELQC